MKASIAAEMIRQAVGVSVQTWLDYAPRDAPMVVYDSDEFILINHPNPPSKRPETLTAATAMEIGGTLTATIPSSMCDDEQSLVPLAYHECFHVYQGKAFQFDGGYDFFAVLAFYPELNYAYRALCSAEADVINDNGLSPLEQATYISALTQKRHEILSHHSGLLDFEKDLERNEGTASFVEQKARREIYGTPPDNSVCHYGYSRQYFMGAAICWLLEKLYPASKWQESIQEGKALSEFLLQATLHETVDLEALNLSRKEEREQMAAELVLANANRQIADLHREGAVTIKLPGKTHISRSFSPQSIVSLGDGRLVHPEFVIIGTPNGQIAIQDEITLENYTEGTVTFRAAPYTVVDNKLEINTGNVKVSLENVRQLQNGIIEVI